MHFKHLGIFFAVLLITLPVAFAQPTHTVSRVIDGDTLQLSNGERVRLIGVDCPEFKDQERNKRNAERLGIELEHYASFAQRSKELLIARLVQVKTKAQRRKVRLEFDAVNEGINHSDKYGRLLAYVYWDTPFPEDTDITFGPSVYHVVHDGNLSDFVNASIIKDGSCTAYTRFDFKHKDKFLELEVEAKENGRGMWE